MAGFVDDIRRALKKNFAGQHTDSTGRVTVPNQFRQPIGLCNGITVEQCDPVATGLLEPQVISFAEAGVVRNQYGLCIGQPLRP